MRILWGLVCAAVCATGVAGEAPFICSNNPAIQPKSRPVVEDLATGNLPIPDYQTTAIACATWDGFRQRGRPDAFPPPPASEWLDAERARYTALLADQPADVLVAPFQIQGYGLDRIERAMMAADLAYAIGDAGALKVADPWLTALALGEGGRRVDPLAVERLAQRVGARKILFAYVGHDFKHTFTLTLKLQDLDAATGAKPWHRDWRSLAFTNEKTPAYVFHGMLPAVLKELPLGLDPKRSSSVRLAPPPATIAVSPLALVSAASNSGADIATMSLLAALLPAGADLARERLFERTLLTTLRANLTKPEQRFFEAYALLNLYRRPVALARIEGATGPAFAALRALLDGNLPAARLATSKVENPLEQLLLQFQLRDLEYRYGIEELTGSTAAARLFVQQATPIWASLVLSRMEDGGRRPSLAATSLKRMLDETFPSAEFAFDALVRGQAVASGKRSNEVDLDLANTRHVRQAATGLKVSPCCRTRDLKPGSWDLLWMLEGAAQERINRDLEQAIFVRGAAAAALADIALYEPLFKGHPRMTALSAHAALRVAEKSRDDERASWSSKSNQAARAVIQWAPGQNRTGYLAALALGIPSPDNRIWLDIYGYDFPRRSDWPSTFVNDHVGPAQALRTAFLTEALAFSTSDISALSELRDEAREAALAALGQRFTGSPGRPQPQPSRRAEDRLAETLAAVKDDPEKNWTLGHQLMSSERPFNEALSAFLAYPPFQKGGARDRVVVANQAYEVGSRFFWLGQGDMAKPLFRIAAGLESGSEASMASQQRLSLLNGDYMGAARMALQRAHRYSSSYAQRDYLSLLHAFGEHDAAWSAFAQLRPAQGDPTLWSSALVGHRMQQLDDPAVRAWLQSAEIRNAKFKAQLFASYYALLWYSTDRMPPAELSALVAELEGKPVARIGAGGVVERPHPVSEDGIEVVQPTFVPDAGKTARLPEGTLLKSERAYFADAYAAVVRGEYSKAVERFGAMARLYPVDGAALPYFAYAAAKGGDPLQLEKYVDIPEPWDDKNFDLMLSRAFFAAARGEVDEAYRLLTFGFRNKPYLGHRPVDIDYQFAQACEWLYRDTKDPRFAAMLLDWARNYQSVQPAMAWSYAIQYQYETKPEARTRALAMTLYLDPLSARIGKAPKADVEKARAWLAGRNPFLVAPEAGKAASHRSTAL